MEKKLPPKNSKFECIYCDFRCNKNNEYQRHIVTKKHNHRLNGNKMETMEIAKTPNFTCSCGKLYLTNAGLWKHKKKCNGTEPTLTSFNNNDKLIEFLIQEHSDLKHLILEIVKKDTISNSNSHNNTNSLNKTFNLQFFLNETCKNAMNITDFVESIQLKLSDLEKVGELGYVEGISNIIINKLKGLDVTERPIHCTDKKREVLYVKDEDLWQKDDQQNKKVRTAIKKITDKNMKLIPHFQKMHPDCGKSTSKIADKYNTIIYESMGGKGDNINEKENKIITNISKQVIVDKEP